jgi:hypothetical protein
MHLVIWFSGRHALEQLNGHAKAIRVQLHERLFEHDLTNTPETQAIGGSCADTQNLSEELRRNVVGSIFIKPGLDLWIDLLKGIDQFHALIRMYNLNQVD